MRTLLIASSALFFVNAGQAFAETLHVKAGQSYTLMQSKPLWDFDELRLDDNSTLVLPKATQLILRGERVYIGDGVTIVASADRGSIGAQGAAYSNAANDCAKPLQGKTGEPGGSGANAPNLELQWRLVEFGDLAVELRGGHGGDGGRGGPGQDADPNADCDRVDGAAGGAGGAAGLPGSGGNLSVQFSAVDDALLLHAQNHVRADLAPGKPGKPGAGGDGGKGSAGRYINKKSLASTRSWQAGGEDGRVGSDGDPAGVAAAGKLSFAIATRPQTSPEAPKPQVAVKTDQGLVERISNLEKLVLELQGRLDQLERKP